MERIASASQQALPLVMCDPRPLNFHHLIGTFLHKSLELLKGRTHPPCLPSTDYLE